MTSSSLFALIVLIISIVTVSAKIEKTKNSDKLKKEEIWQQDMTDAFTIDASTEGLQKVHLRCGADSMQLELETEEDFEGVMYTRGSYHRQAEPCFVKPNLKRGQRSLAMKFSFNQCQTLHDGDVFSNVVVIQHDPELVTPGDAAFSVECDFRKPRELTVDADMQARDRQLFGSRITLTSPDISKSADLKITDETSFFSESDSVTFDPKGLRAKQKVEGTVESIQILDEDEESMEFGQRSADEL